MQHLNNDMEKFLRKAAKNAPVRPKGMNWEEVNAQLQHLQAETGKARKIGYKKYWFVLLFILPSLVCDKYLINGFEVGATVLPMGKTKSLADVGFDKATNSNKDELFSNQKQNRSINPIKQNLISIDRAQIQQALTTYLIHNKIIAHNNFMQHEVLKKLAQPVTAKSKLEISEEQSASLFPPTTKNNIIKKRHNAFYTSVVMAPELSTVKYQKIQKIGYSVGVKAGYQINKKWAVETGLLWQRKNYYADGKTFSTEKLGLPQHTKILNATGYCDMFDIPIDVRYSFKKSQTNNWYALAGASTYLMQNEDYNAQCERYGQKYNYSWYNSKASKYIFSVINIGLGYEHQIGRLGKIRIEPYAKLPVKQIGIGKLPITSTGLNFGFTHPL